MCFGLPVWEMAWDTKDEISNLLEVGDMNLGIYWNSLWNYVKQIRFLRLMKCGVILLDRLGSRSTCLCELNSGHNGRAGSISHGEEKDRVGVLCTVMGVSKTWN